MEQILERDRGGSDASRPRIRTRGIDDIGNGMALLMKLSQTTDSFTIEHHGEVTLIIAAPALESLDPSLEDQVARLLMSPLREQNAPQVVFDLSGVNYFGSMFLAVLLKCWKLITSTGGSMVLAGVSTPARELLRITSLDLIWPMYPGRREAMEALLSD